jgi:hypothetical protein
MSEFLRQGIYRITSISSGCTAMIRNDENVLRGEPIADDDITLVS